MNLHPFLLACVFLACCSKSPDNNPGSGNPADPGKWPTQPALPVVSGNASFVISKTEWSVNVMGNTAPRMPLFPSVPVKKGYARGYVADLAGRPLKGATIGLRATLVGGSYSGASGKTNDNGYYEIKLPFGACQYYTTATTIAYGAGQAVVGLYPADGDIESFASDDGDVQNFVMLSYAPGDPEEIASQPNNETNYYGGTLYFNYQINYAAESYPTYLPNDGEIEIELVPEGAGLFGETKSFKITRSIGTTLFSINNIPVGKYSIKARLKNGPDLHMKATGPVANVYQHFGLKPDDVTGNSTVMFTPTWQSTPQMVPAFRSNWDALTITLSLP
ncbi:MAG: hypothetical protein EOO05_09605 [Chitinophagaceae bacterium]|nr:MAG: hypothetical protein EOO05_09605 [Chitinophagaceae bacterium]